MKHVVILKILTYLGIEPVSRFILEIVTLTENMILVTLQSLETIMNCQNCIIDVYQNYSYLSGSGLKYPIMFYTLLQRQFKDLAV